MSQAGDQMQDLYVHMARDNHHLNSCRRKPVEEMTQYCFSYMVTKLHRTNIDLGITRINLYRMFYHTLQLQSSVYVRRQTYFNDISTPLALSCPAASPSHSPRTPSKSGHNRKQDYGMK